MPSLRALLESDIEVPLVVTNPDRPAGRKLELHAPPVKDAALEAGVEVLQPDKARDPDFQERLRATEPDVAAVVAYGKILPASLLEVPRLGFVNLHFSLLPAYRGAAPVQRALMDGVDETGVTIMVLTEGMDEGPILAMERAAVGPDETTGELGERLARDGAPLLVDTLRAFAAGEVQPQEQDHDRATYASKITSQEARIDWSLPAKTIHDLARGLNPAPGAWTTFRGNRLKVLRTRVTEGPAGRPGEVTADDLIVTGDGALELVEVQPAGKRAMPGDDLFRGLRPAPGEAME